MPACDATGCALVAGGKKDNRTNGALHRGLRFDAMRCNAIQCGVLWAPYQSSLSTRTGRSMDRQNPLMRLHGIIRPSLFLGSPQLCLDGRVYINRSWQNTQRRLETQHYVITTVCRNTKRNVGNFCDASFLVVIIKRFCISASYYYSLLVCAVQVFVARERLKKEWQNPLRVAPLS